MPFIQALSRGRMAGHGRYGLPNSFTVPVKEDGGGNENCIEADIDEKVADDGGEDAEEAPGLWAMEKDLQILPGEKVFMTVGCQAK